VFKGVKTKDHWCLYPKLFFVHTFLNLGIDLQNGPGAPQCWAFSSFGFEHHYISDFCGTLKYFWNSFMPPPALFGHF
jgi:hypothetical protein